MRPSRTLALRKERLAPLSGGDLRGVAGAAITRPADCFAAVGSIENPTGCVAAVASLENFTDCASKVVECDSYLRPCISHTCTL